MIAKVIERKGYPDLRVTKIDGTPWFISKDVLDIIDKDYNFLYKYALKEKKRICYFSDKNKEELIGIWGEKHNERSILSEEGFAKVMLATGSKKYRNYANWVIQEVLPTLWENNMENGDEKMEPNELIKVKFNDEEEVGKVSGRDLHKSLEIKSKYNDWIKRMLSYGFLENTDFVLVTQKKETNNPKNPITEITDHEMTLDMAKEIAMIQRNEIGKAIRKYLIEVEKKYKEQLNSISEMDKLKLQLFSDDKLEVVNAHKKIIELEKIPLLETIEKQDKAIYEKDIIIDEIIDDNTLIGVGPFGRMLGSYTKEMGQNKIFTYLYDHKILHKDKTVYNDYKKYFKPKPINPAPGIERYYCRFTGVGVKWFLKRIVKEGIITKTQKKEIEKEITQ